MKVMNRNKRTFYFASYVSKDPIHDEYGNLTSEWNITYGNPVKVRANISPANGVTEYWQFGETEHYDKTIITEKSVVDGNKIDIHSVLWVDTKPVINEDGSTDTPYDYIVYKVAQSLNNVMIAIRKVEVS